MAIPDYQTCMLPVLKFSEDKHTHHFKEAVNNVADFFKLTEDERQELLPSGKQQVIANRIGWARTYLKKAGLLEDPKRGYFQITDSGLKYLSSKPVSISTKDLEQFESFKEFRKKSNSKTIEDENLTGQNSTPQEALEFGFLKLTETLVDDLLDIIKTSSPAFFEKVVVELLVKMGYGGSLREAAQVVGKSGDAGIDGIIKEDKLGLETIYIQAKRWENVIGRPEIQKFAGALLGQKARKGIFVTTSYFSREAIEYAFQLETKIVLIDGKKLTELMIDVGLGVSTVETYEIKKVDTDYFIDE